MSDDKWNAVDCMNFIDDNRDTLNLVTTKAEVDVLYASIDGFADLEAQQRWIPVSSEGNPTEYGRYLIKYEQYGREQRPFIADWDYPELGGRWTNLMPDMTITHYRGPIEKYDG